MSNNSGSKLEFHCPQCDKKLKVPREYAGKNIKCPACETKIKVPSLPTVAKEDEDWLSLDEPSLDPSVVMPPKKEKSHHYGWEKKEAPTSPAEKSTPSKPKSAASEDDEQGDAGSKSSTKEVDRKERGDEPRKPAAKPVAATPRQSSFDEDEDFFRLAPEEPKAPNASDLNARKPAAAAPLPDYDIDLPELAPLEDIPKAASPARYTSNVPIDHDLLDLDPLELPSDPAGPASTAGQAPRQPKPAKARYDLEAELKGFDEQIAEDAGREFRVKCKTCGTLLYASVNQVGNSIKCPDCFSSFVIPAPPPGWNRKKPSRLEEESPEQVKVRLAAAEGKGKNESNLMDRNANDVLRRAEQAISDEEEKVEQYTFDFDTKGWFHRSFSFLRDPSLVVISIASGMLLAIVFGVSRAFGGLDEVSKGMIVALQILVLVGGGIPVLAVLLSNGLAVLQASANRLARVPEWPLMHPGDWMSEGFVVVAAFVCAATPGGALGALLQQLEPSPLMMLAGVLLTTWFLFPPILLSMLDNQSLFQPYSSNIFSSYTKKADAWGALYMMSAVGSLTVFGLMCGAIVGSSSVAVTAGLLLPFFVFFLFHQLGILAARISDVTDLGFEPEPSDEPEAEPV